MQKICRFSPSRSSLLWAFVHSFGFDYRNTMVLKHEMQMNLFNEIVQSSTVQVGRNSNTLGKETDSITVPIMQVPVRLTCTRQSVPWKYHERLKFYFRISAQYSNPSMVKLGKPRNLQRKTSRCKTLVWSIASKFDCRKAMWFIDEQITHASSTQWIPISFPLLCNRTISTTNWSKVRLHDGPTCALYNPTVFSR